MRSVPWLLLSGLLALQRLEAKTWHVSPEPLQTVAPGVQLRSINEAAGKVEPGDVVLIHSGVYREAVVVEKSGTAAQPIRFEAAPSANVTITGADILLAWQDEGENVYSTEWPHRFVSWSKTDSHPDDEYHRLIGRPEQVFADGYALQQTLTREALSRGTFFVDFEARRLFVATATGEPPAGTTGGRPVIEASTRPMLLHCRGANVVIRGIEFRYAANAAQEGAVTLSGRGDVVEDCTFERTSGVGLVFVETDQAARRCLMQQNGALGFAATRSHNLSVTECVVRNNNTKGFNRNWQAGGAKIVLSRGVRVERSQFIENRGPGVWFDIGNENGSVRNCLIADNEGAGIFYEISYGLVAEDNVIVGNGLAPDPRAWGMQAGISVSSSPHCLVQRNLLVANKEGFSFREQRRTTPRIDGPAEREELIWNRDAKITQNIIANNRDAQTTGWFGTEDEQHWPRALQEANDANGSDLSLEELQLRFSENLYAVDDGQPLIVWGAQWMRHVVYPTVAEVRKALGFEQGSRVASIQFGNYAARDFRVARDSVALRMNCYPRGDVPGVLLGVLPNSSTRVGQPRSLLRDLKRKAADDRLQDR